MRSQCGKGRETENIMTPDEKLAEWQALCDKATPGPWEASRETAIDYRPTYVHGNNGKSCVALCCGGGPDKVVLSPEERANGDFIAAARTALPTLIATVQELKLKNESWALGVEHSNTDIVDMQRDEFKRIIALSPSEEIKGICERAIAVIEQTVPVVIQRDNLQIELWKSKRELKALETEVQELKRDGEVTNVITKVGQLRDALRLVTAVVPNFDLVSICDQGMRDKLLSVVNQAIAQEGGGK